MGQMTDPFDDAELRARAAALRAEWRDDEEEWTRAAFERWEHGRTLVDVARDCMHRGDTVVIITAGVAFRGEIVAVGADTARVAVDRERAVDVNLAGDAPVVLRVDGRVRTRGSHDTDGARTFRARLLEREVDDRVELGAPVLAESLVGTLRVSADHVRIRTRDGADTFVPLRSVAWVRQHRP